MKLGRVPVKSEGSAFRYEEHAGPWKPRKKPWRWRFWYWLKRKVEGEE